MRIAIDATYSVDPHPSGIAVYSRELLHGLAARHPEDHFVECYRFKQWRQRPPSTHANTSSRLLQWPLPLGRADLFHALNQRVDWRPAKRVIATFHDLFVMTAEYSSLEFRHRFTAQAKGAAERSDAIIAVSRFTAEQVHALLKVERSKIRVIPHGVHFPPVLPSGEREKTVLCVGALQLRKNTARLVESFEKSGRTDWRLILAGSPTGFGAGQITEAIHSSPARNQIEIAGYVSPQKLRRLYETAGIFAFVSLDEGFGIPVLEAMANGVPVLTSDRAALKEICGEAALFVDPISTDAITSSLSRLMEDEDLRERLRAEGRRRVTQFNWERSVEETYQLYREVAG